MYIYCERETCEAEWGWRLALDFVCSSFFLQQQRQQCSDQTATKHISFLCPCTTTPLLPPSLQHCLVLSCSTAASLLCRKSFTNSASCLPPTPPLPSTNFTSLDISQHTHVLHQGREMSPENDFPPERRRWCPPSPAPATLVLVVTLYEVGPVSRAPPLYSTPIVSTPSHISGSVLITQH